MFVNSWKLKTHKNLALYGIWPSCFHVESIIKIIFEGFLLSHNLVKHGILYLSSFLGELVVDLSFPSALLCIYIYDKYTMCTIGYSIPYRVIVAWIGTNSFIISTYIIIAMLLAILWEICTHMIWFKHSTVCSKFMYFSSSVSTSPPWSLTHHRCPGRFHPSQHHRTLLHHNPEDGRPLLQWKSSGDFTCHLRNYFVYLLLKNISDNLTWCFVNNPADIHLASREWVGVVLQQKRLNKNRLKGQKP